MIPAAAGERRWPCRMEGDIGTDLRVSLDDLANVCALRVRVRVRVRAPVS